MNYVNVWRLHEKWTCDSKGGHGLRESIIFGLDIKKFCTIIRALLLLEYLHHI